MSSIPPSSSKPIDNPPDQSGVSSKGKGLAIKPQFPVQGVSDPVTVKNSISNYCQKHDIKLPSSTNLDFGAALLSTGNDVLAEAAKRGEKEVVRHLLETPRRVLAQQKAEKVSQPKLGSAEQTNQENVHLTRSLASRFRDNVISCNIKEFPKEAREVFKQFVAEKENWDSILSTASYENDICTFLNNVLTAVEKTPPAEINKGLHLSLAKRVASEGAAEAVIEKIDHFAPELKERISLFQWLFKEGEADVAMNHIEAFNVDSWSEEDWVDCLEAAKNHIRGVDLAKRVPDKFKSEKIKGLIKACEESRAALEKVAGVMWNPVSRVFDPESGGYRITFEAKIDFSKDTDQLIKLFAECYPAVEPSPESITSLLDKDEDDGKLFLDFLKNVGFTFKDVTREKGPISKKNATLTMPDVDVINYHYALFRKSHPELPELSIYLCDGILPDEEFLNKELEFDVVCSADKERVHDMGLHCLPTVEFIMTNPKEYIRFKKQWTSELKEAKDKLDEFASKKDLDSETYKQLLFLISFQADTYGALDSSNYKFYTLVLKDLPLLIEEINEDNPLFLDQTFEGNFKGYDSLNDTWQEVLKLVD